MRSSVQMREAGIVYNICLSRFRVRVRGVGLGLGLGIGLMVRVDG